MSKLLTTMGRAIGFAHLAGLTKSSRAASADDDKDKQREGESDEDYAKRMEEKEDKDEKDQDRDDGDSKNSKKGKAEDDKDDERAEDGDEDQDESDKKTKKGKKADDSGESEDADDEDDKDEEMRGKSPAAAARRRERQRCAAIFNDRAAARNPQMAAQLAFNTTMPRSEAISVLRSAPAAASAGDSRQQRNPQLGPGGDKSITSAQKAEASWDTAMKKVRGA